MITLAKPLDAATIHQVMLAAFEEYRNTAIPSSALDETEESIKILLKEEKEGALICWRDQTAVGAVRFKAQGNALYFFRLSVDPGERGRGIAKKLLAALADHAVHSGFPLLCCQVRLSVPRNIILYQRDRFYISDRKTVIKPDGAKVETVYMTKKL